MRRDLSTTALLLLLAVAVAHGFLHPRSCLPMGMRTEASNRSPHFVLSSSADDDDHDDESIDPNSLGDWRTFRMNLANTDLPAEAPSSIDGLNFEDAAAPSASAASAAEIAPSSPNRPTSVSKRNEALLTSQNSAMAEEYLNGAWAHESAVPELGGLMCRMPLEAELRRGGESALQRKLEAFLESDEYGMTEETVPGGLAASASTGGAAAASVAPSRGVVGPPQEGAAGSDGEPSSFSALAATTTFWYRGAEKMLKRELANIMSTASTRGEINADELGEDSLELLQMYMHHQNTWQSVELVVEKDERTGSATTLTINRPMAFKLSESLGRLLLLGAIYAEKGGPAVNINESNGIETQNIVKLLSAFENQCGVYVGGPDDMDKPAVIVHGIGDLAGAVEISPGTGIYRGGIEAACDGVLSGQYKPLDFRFFIGRMNYVGGALDESVNRGRYQPVACSRPLVLKQCIQLPKPLWHEVLEFCGGELKEISRLELAKREDLQ